MNVLKMLYTRKVMTVDYGETLVKAARIMRDKKIGSLLVVKDGKTVGILSETDITRKAVAGGRSAEKAKVESVMSRPVITIDILSTPEKANDLMKEKGIRHLAVTDQGEIAGILSVRDLLNYFKVYYDGIGTLKRK
jgi:CBS domain-containing protein